MRHFVKNICIILGFVVCMAGLFSACKKNFSDFDDSVKDLISENMNKMSEETTKTLNIPVPANDFAMKKSTEVETAEPTNAHHAYTDIGFRPEKEVVLGQKDFLNKINYIYNHINDFVNSTIIVEGMYGWYYSWDETFSFPMIYRNGPACCGDDQYGGFYLVNINNEEFNLDDWLRVTGKPFMYDHTDSEGQNVKYLFILVDKVEVLPTNRRGLEMVNG